VYTGLVLPGLPIFVLVLARGSLGLLGDGECPTSRQILHEVALVNPAVLEGPVRHLALVQRTEQGLEVRLFDETGGLLEERVVRGAESCAGWARTAAVVLVSWEAEFAGPAPSLLTSPAPATPPPTVPAAVSVQAVPPPNRHAWVGELGIGLIGSAAGNGLAAPGVDLRAAFEPTARPYGGELILLALAPRTVPLGQGSANWGWFALGLGGHLTLGSRAVRLEFAADPLAALFTARGAGFDVPRTATSFVPGIMASARLRWAVSDTWLAWIQIGGLAWFKAEQVQMFTGSTPASSAPIPRAEVLAILGFSLLEPL
jgi:hypothetical protein